MPRQFEMASRALVREFRLEVVEILDAIGHPEALVTDESTLWDFSLEPLEYALAEEALGVKFDHVHERLVDIASRMRTVGKGRG